jgi:hypothetical protein
MVTAEEFHTEFVSASIVYKSGSTKFGDDIDDIHSFTGSINQSGSFNLNDGNMSVTDTLTATTLTGTTIKDFSTISGSSTSTGSFGSAHIADKVGIGTTAPSGPLDIEVTSDHARIYLNSVTSGDSGIDFQESGTRKWLLMNEKSSASELQFKTNSATVMTLLQGGNVGIGQTSPASNVRLHVKGSGNTSTDTMIRMDNSDDTICWEVSENGRGHLRNALIIGGSDGFSSQIASGIYVATGNISGSSTSTGSFGDGRFAGNVGIGTTSPVNNGGWAGLTLNGSTGGQIDFQDDGTTIGAIYSGTWGLYVGATSGKYLKLGANNAEAMRIDSAGNVGIGTTSPGTLLHLSSSATTELTVDGVAHSLVTLDQSGTQKGAVGYSNSDSTVKLYAGSGGIATNTNGISIDSSGNVGIGTATPTNYDSAADNLVIYGTSHTGMTLATNGANSLSIYFADGTGADSENEGSISYDHGNDGMTFGTNHATRLKIDSSGHVTPNVTNTQDLGSTTARWANIYTSDLHLKNEKGDWTVEEGEDDLFITNNKTGKKFKFKLEEVT